MSGKRESVFITGGDGFLGSRLAEYYRERYQVSSITHSMLDITDKDAVYSCLKNARPDYVIHCAAVSDTGVCEKNPRLSYRINVEGTANLAGACAEAGGKFIFMSSDQIYSGVSHMEPNGEEGEYVPDNVYGRDKKKAEEETLSILPEAVCLRLTWMYDFPVRGKRTNRNLLCNVVRALVRDCPLKLPTHDYRGITWAGEVAEQMEKAMRLPGGIYNFGSGNSQNTFETGRFLLGLISKGREELLEKDEERFRETPRNLRLYTGKIREAGIVFSSTEAGFEKCLSANPEYTEALF